jgi:hypothetical protein
VNATFTFLIALGVTCVLAGLCVKLVHLGLALAQEEFVACLVIATISTGLMLCSVATVGILWAVWWSTLGGAK